MSRASFRELVSIAHEDAHGVPCNVWKSARVLPTPAPGHEPATSGAIVYFVQMGDAGPIKIGRTRAELLWKRIKALQTSSPEPLNLRRVVAVEHPSTEITLHDALAPYRMRGEWFRPEGHVLTLAGLRQPVTPGTWTVIR